MFIKTSTKKVPNDKPYTTHYLVEAYRDKKTGKSKHRYISNLTALPDKCILILKKALKSRTGEIETMNLADLEVLCSKEYGSIKLFQSLFKKYFGKLLKSKKYSRALEAIVINKIFEPKSKNSLQNWLNYVDLGYSFSNKNDLYDCLDYLENEQDNIEQTLSKQLTKNGSNMLLYDVTSTYFEGKGAENICKYGYSRDKRPDRVQVNIGVITAKDGTPVSVEVIAGNISDKQTLQDQIDKIREKHGIKDISFVFDRGMKSKVNLDYLTESGYSYITALSHSELKKKCIDHQDLQCSLFDKSDLSEFTIDGKNYTLVHNPIKEDRDKKTRWSLIAKTEEKLSKIVQLKRNYTACQLQGKVSKVINKYGMEKFITYSIKETESVESTKEVGAKLVYQKDIDKIIDAEKYDGFYMIESTSPYTSGEDAVKQYKDLQLVERAFDSVKNHIQLRPVFHYKLSRIKGHIFSCFMSYFLLHKFKQQCSELLTTHTLDELLSELRRIHKVYLKIQGVYIDKLTNISDLSQKILSNFKIRI